MKLTDVAIHRPVTVLMMVCLLVLSGLISIFGLPVDLFPEMEFPYISIRTEYEGVGPEEIETSITEPIEEVVATVENVKEIRSYSREGWSYVYVKFTWGTDLDIARLDVRESVDLIASMLPEEAEEPIVSKRSFMGGDSVVWVSLSSPEVGLDKLRKIAKETVKPRIERIKGVALAEVRGGLEREIQVRVDARKLKAYDLSLNEIAGTLRAENLNNPGGRIERGRNEYLVRTVGKLHSIEEIEDLVVVRRGTSNIRVRDIASVKDTFEEQRSYARFNGTPTVELAVLKESDANVVQIAKVVREEVQNLKPMLSQISLDISYDGSDFIMQSIITVRENAIYGTIFATVVLLLFFRNIASTVIIALAIPVSVIATFNLINFAGLSLNMLSLGGLALGVGMLVDNSVVVLENIFRYLQLGSSPREAASKGTSQIAVAVTVSTLTTLAVFLPIVWIQGISKEIFTDFSLTVAFSLASSLLVAFTVMPTFAGAFLRPSKKSVEVVDGTAFGRLQRVYRPVLTWALRHRWAVVAISVTLFAVSGVGFAFVVPRSFFPKMDFDTFDVDVELPVGSSLDETDAMARTIERIVLDEPDVDFTVAYVVAGEMEIAATLKKYGERRPTEEVTDGLRAKLRDLPGVKWEFQNMGGTSGGSPLEVVICGKDRSVLSELGEEAKRRLAAISGAVDITSSDEEGRPEIQVRIDRKRAADFGIDVRTIASIVETAMNGRVVSRLDESGDETDIRVQLREEDRRNKAQLEEIVLAKGSGMTFPLSEVAHVGFSLGPVVIQRKDQKRIVRVEGNTSGDKKLSELQAEIVEAMEGMSFPPGTYWEFGGEVSDMEEAFGGLTKAFLIAIVLVYIILAAEFESLVHPFTIMLTVPLAIVGVFFALLASGKPLNIPAFVGVIMLAGIVVNNAIVMIDYILHLRRDGLERHEAIVRGGVVRLRPILITATTTVLGMVPMAFGWGEGARFYSTLGITVIGGLTMSTLLTLVVVPVVYSLFDDLSAKLTRVLGLRQPG